MESNVNVNAKGGKNVPNLLLHSQLDKQESCKHNMHVLNVRKSRRGRYLIATKSHCSQCDLLIS